MRKRVSFPTIHAGWWPGVQPLGQAVFKNELPFGVPAVADCTQPVQYRNASGATKLASDAPPSSAGSLNPYQSRVLSCEPSRKLPS